MKENMYSSSSRVYKKKVAVELVPRHSVLIPRNIKQVSKA